MENNIEVKILDAPQKVAKAVAKEIVAMMRDSGQQRFDIALSGGKTPLILFEKLVDKYLEKIHWQHIHFWWSDERCVNPDSDQSNYKAAYELLLSKVPVSENQIHRIRGEENPENEAERYGKSIADELNFRGEWPVFDLVLLGMGDDGHTASIFPNQMHLLESNLICEVATRTGNGQLRITLTGKVINNASRILILATGEKKSQRIAEIMNNEDSAKLLPVYYINPEHGKLIWFLDVKSAALL